MKSQINQHPSLNYTQDIDDICRPLQKLKINYFAHVRVDKNGLFTAINNSAGFMNHYLSNEYYNADIHMADSNRFGNYVIWDAIERHGQSEKMHSEAAQFGIQHTFTIIDKKEEQTDFYHFANNSTSKSINQTYLANLDLLKVFITYFNENINQSKKLSAAYELPFAVNSQIGGYFINEDTNLVVCNRQEFIQTICQDTNKEIKKFNSSLTPREIQCVGYLVRGKSAREISKLLGLSKRTVEFYLANIKSKLGVSTKSELIEKMFNLFK